MNYFKDCKTIEEVKAKYKKLAKEFHPDLGGSTEIMHTINTEYAFACAHVLKGSGLSEDQKNDQMNFSEQYRETIEKIIHLPSILIEVIGFWVWVTGNTRPEKNELKAARFFFASKKCAWYYRSDEYKTRGGKKSLEEIRRKYGSETILTKQQGFLK